MIMTLIKAQIFLMMLDFINSNFISIQDVTKKNVCLTVMPGRLVMEIRNSVLPLSVGLSEAHVRLGWLVEAKGRESPGRPRPPVEERRPRGGDEQVGTPSREMVSRDHDWHHHHLVQRSVRPWRPRSIPAHIAPIDPSLCEVQGADCEQCEPQEETHGDAGYRESFRVTRTTRQQKLVFFSRSMSQLSPSHLHVHSLATSQMATLDS